MNDIRMHHQPRQQRGATLRTFVSDPERTSFLEVRAIACIGTLTSHFPSLSQGRTLP
jgi:hypothetical protein